MFAGLVNKTKNGGSFGINFTMCSKSYSGDFHSSTNQVSAAITSNLINHAPGSLLSLGLGWDDEVLGLSCI